MTEIITKFSEEGREAIKEICKELIQPERMRINILKNQIDYALKELQKLKELK